MLQGLVLSFFCLFSVVGWADWSGTKGRLILSNESYLSPDYDKTSEKQLGSFSAGLRTLRSFEVGQKETWEESGFEADLLGSFSFNSSALSTLNFRELMYQDSRLALGRKRLVWSALDQDWLLGSTNPLFRANPLTPEEQGLTGVFLRMEDQLLGAPWDLVFFGSFLSLPDQNPGYQIKNGKVERSSPWIEPPPQKVRFESTGAVDSIEYQIQNPDLNKILLNTSFAARFQWGQNEQGGRFRSSYLYKPSNQLALAYDGFVKPRGVVEVQVTAQSSYTRVLSADLGYRQGVHDFFAGVISDRPEAPVFDNRWTYQVNPESLATQAGYQMILKNWVFKYAHLWTSEATPQLVGPKLEQASPFVRRKTIWLSSHSLEALTKWRLVRNRSLTASTQWRQSDDSSVVLWSNRFGYDFADRWNGFVEGTLVRLTDQAREQRLAWADYDSNDFVLVGVRHVF